MIVNLIMNEYICNGKGHTIHSSGQIEWFKNSVDDRSVQVGGKQRICTIDGYAMPLVCRGGLMYLSLLGKPSDEDLERDTLVADAYPRKSGKQFVNMLEDNITRRGAMDKNFSDSAKTEISNKVMDILKSYHQNQNHAESRYRTIQYWTSTVMNRSGAPANCWLLCLIYVCYLLNHIACAALL